jgi:hypothetical protein
MVNDTEDFERDSKKKATCRKFKYVEDQGTLISFSEKLTARVRVF